MKHNNEVKCDKETMCVVCPYIYCVDEEKNVSKINQRYNASGRMGIALDSYLV